MLANKQNLTLLSDSQILRSWGLDEAAVECLERSVPRTKIVSKRRCSRVVAYSGGNCFLSQLLVMEAKAFIAVANDSASLKTF